MRKGVFIVGLLLTALITNGQSFEKRTRPVRDSLPVNDKDFNNKILYDVFVRSYFDSNRDGIGDLNGLSSKLFNIYSLGAEGVCISPINPSPSSDNFAVTNFYKVDSVYGDTASLKKLVAAAHQLHLKVILNIPFTHVSVKHPWFVSAVSGKSSEFADYFIWKDEKSISSDKKNWYSIPEKSGKQLVGKKYYSTFGSKMPDLNFNNDAVKAEVIKIGTYWLKEFDLDGFKVEGSQLYFEDNANSKSNKWWNDFHAEMKKVKPAFYLMGDFLKGNNGTVEGKGIDALVNNEIPDIIIDIVKNQADSSLVERLVRIRTSNTKESAELIDVINLGNQHQDRVMSKMNGDIEKAKTAATLLFTLPGAPSILYGEEIGMFGKMPEESIREPYLWSDAKNAGGKTTWQKSKYNNTQDVKSLRIISKDTASIFSHYKKLTVLRRTTPALNGSGIENVKVDDEHIICFIRSNGDKKVLVVVNLSAKDTSADIDFNGTTGNAVFETGKVFVSEGKLICSPNSSAVFNLN